MKQLYLLMLLLGCLSAANAQDFIAKTYTYSETENIVYGQQTDFAGNQRTLLLDVFLPTNDTPPECGRPLFVAVHGGAWMAGSKDDITPTELCKDFAQRGYVAVSVSYRLGLFQTHHNAHCNVAGWDCFNAADSSEWLRALYRATQDVKGAIRYMVKNGGTYQIDPRNVFVAGESAGGYISLAVGFMDLPEEKPADCGALPAVLPPNSYAETNCVQAYGLDTSVASMQLTRPDLGSINGSLHTDAPPYTLRGVGSFYGGLFQNILAQQAGNTPALYLYHQPNDLLVPYKEGHLAKDYDYCAVTLGGCAYIQYLPYTWGGSGIARLILTGSGGSPAPVLRFDSTLNMADCATQIVNPSTTGHAIDNFALRSQNLAAFFAAQIEGGSDCSLSIAGVARKDGLWLFPNPAGGGPITLNGIKGSEVRVRLSDPSGRISMEQTLNAVNGQASIQLPQGLAAGLYLLSVRDEEGARTLRLVVR